MSLKLKPNNALGFACGQVWPGLDGWTEYNGSFLGQVSDSSCTKRKAIRAETASAKETRHSEECGTRPARELEEGG
jgi:hypothetical protein